MFLRKIFGKKEKPPEVRELTLDLLEEEIRNSRKTKLKNIEETVRPKIDEIFRLCGSVDKSVETLAKAEATEFVHPGLEKTSLEARRLYVQKVTRAIQGLKRPAVLTWQELLNFRAALNQALKLITGASVSHRRHILVLFKQPMKNTQRLIHALLESATGLEGIIGRETDEIKAFDEISLKISDQRERVQTLTRLRARKKSLENRAKELENFVKEKNAEVDQLVKSRESKRLEDVRRELDQIERKITELENKARSVISDLGRPLRKMMKLTLNSERLDKEKARMLKLCIENPLDAFRSDREDLPKLTPLLRELATNIETGEVGLDLHEKEKKLGQIRRMLDGGLSSLKAEHVELMAQKVSKKNELEISPLPKREAKLKKSLDFNRSELVKTQSKLSEVSKELEKIGREIERKKLELKASATKILGVELKIV